MVIAAVPGSTGLSVMLIVGLPLPFPSVTPIWFEVPVI
jgi:hypothetical protein